MHSSSIIAYPNKLICTVQQYKIYQELIKLSKLVQNGRSGQYKSMSHPATVLFNQVGYSVVQIPPFVILPLQNKVTPRIWIYNKGHREEDKKESCNNNLNKIESDTYSPWILGK